VAQIVRLPDLAFSEYFGDHNHQHNLSEQDVMDALIGRRIHISARYRHDGKLRRRILAKTDSNFITVICEEADTFWWVLSAFPSAKADIDRARSMGIGE
jgi:hypothetical protein